MEVLNQNNEKLLRAERYYLRLPADRPFVVLESPQGEQLAELFPFSSVHPLDGRDDTYQTGPWEFQPTADGYTLSCTVRSTAWTAKTYRFRCTPRRLTYEIEVEGEGRLAEALYFGGYYAESLRWGSGFFWSGQRFRQVFNPEPNIPEIFHHHPISHTRIDMTGVPIPARGDWFFTPPPFCFAAQVTDGWLALGVEAAPGSNTFMEYHYCGSEGAFYLALSYEGYTTVRGRVTLPAIGFDFAPDEYTALGAHVAALRAAGLVPIPHRETTPDWWQTPIFCGWGAQCHIASQEGGRAPEYARQSLYEDFLAALETHDLRPGIIVLDDKWQATYGDSRADTAKWPDLPGFIAGQHRRGRRVLLWFKAWDPEGVPVEECITHPGGLPVAVDPTHPAYERRLRAAIRQMLSPAGYDADGFKIDFTARIPSGPGLRGHRPVWGLELMRHYLSIIYDEAKQAKPDALIMTHTAHPYLADVLDMIRLNDINIGQDVLRAMMHRARVARLACPEAIIDTDNWPITDRATWRAYVALQPELGVPSLYYATHLDATGEPLTDDDYRLIREGWAHWRARTAGRES